jgi:hypothetical protein
MQVNSRGKCPLEEDLDGQPVDVELFSAAYRPYGLQDIYNLSNTTYIIQLEISLVGADLWALEKFRVLLQAVEGTAISLSKPL